MEHKPPKVVKPKKPEEAKAVEIEYLEENEMMFDGPKPNQNAKKHLSKMNSFIGSVPAVHGLAPKRSSSPKIGGHNRSRSRRND